VLCLTRRQPPAPKFRRQTQPRAGAGCTVSAIDPPAATKANPAYAGEPSWRSARPGKDHAPSSSHGTRMSGGATEVTRCTYVAVPTEIRPPPVRFQNSRLWRVVNLCRKFRPYRDISPTTHGSPDPYA
jgi:hypothetical protein